MSMQEVFRKHIDAAEGAGMGEGADRLREMWSEFADLALKGEVPVLPASGTRATPAVIYRSREGMVNISRLRANMVRFNPDAVREALPGAPRFSQKELAEEVGRSQQAVSRWLRGKGGVPLEAVPHIAFRLNTDPSLIVHEEDLPKVERWLNDNPPGDKASE